MTDKSPNPNFKALTKEHLLNLKLKSSANAQPTAERAFSRLSLMSEMEEEEVETGKVYDTELMDGKDLPESLGTFPKSLYGKPIEELDAVRHDEQVHKDNNRFFLTLLLFQPIFLLLNVAHFMQSFSNLLHLFDQPLTIVQPIPASSPYHQLHIVCSWF